jgi:hypothetical protein
VCIVLVLYLEDIENWWEVRRTSRELPAAQARFNQIQDGVYAITDDVLIEEHVVAELHVPGRFYTNCMRALIERMYGTDNTWDEILAEYSRGFERMGWKLGRETRENRVSYSIETSIVSIEFPESVEDKGLVAQEYQTVYILRFLYAESEVLACYG